MKRVLLVLFALSTVAVGGAAAANNSTSTTTATGPPVATGGHPVAVDGVLSVQGWDYEDGRMNVTLQASQYKSATLAASATSTGRVAQAAYRQVLLQRGETVTVSLPADRIDGQASVSVTTGACIASGSCPTLYSNDNTGPWLTGGSLVGWLGGAGGAIVVFFGVGWWVMTRNADAPEVA